ncbi:MAG: Sec-independent protein translocase protein TatB [Hyphomicrobiaceae bacterium]
MFDIGWSEIVVIGIVALLVVGPKELPALLRTVGRYFGMVKKQAAEFRSQFDEAMREAELDQLKKDLESAKTQVETTLHETKHTVESEIGRAQTELDTAVANTDLTPEKDKPAAPAADTAKAANGATALPSADNAPATVTAGGEGTPAAPGGEAPPAPEPERDSDRRPKA